MIPTQQGFLGRFTNIVMQQTQKYSRGKKVKRKAKAREKGKKVLMIYVQKPPRVFSYSFLNTKVNFIEIERFTEKKYHRHSYVFNNLIKKISNFLPKKQNEQYLLKLFLINNQVRIRCIYILYKNIMVTWSYFPVVESKALVQ